MEKLLICSVCFDEKEIISLRCNCQICHDCMCEWAIEYGKKFRRKSEYLKCPTDNCPQLFLYSDLIKILDARKQEILNDFLLKKYLQTSSDVRICPGKDCQNAVFVDKKECREWNCQKCESTWKTGEEEKFIPLFQFPSLDRNELYTTLSKEFYLNQCPKCEIPIEKNGGCQFMLCQNCGHDFCWKCFQDTDSHSKKKCKISWFTKFLLFLYLAFNIIMKFQFTYILYRSYIEPAFKMLYYFLQIYLLKYMLVFNGFCFMSIGLLSAVITSIKRNTKGDVWAMVAMSALEGFYLFFICYFFSLYECIYAYAVQILWFFGLYLIFQGLKLAKRVWIDSVL